MKMSSKFINGASLIQDDLKSLNYHAIA